jgi:aryl-alcohol dehydrogenase-like predicted oxidoreductase
MFENKNYLYQLEEEIDTNDLYTNGKKLRILKSLIQSRKDIPTEKVILSKYAQQQLAVYNNKKKKILGS